MSCKKGGEGFSQPSERFPALTSYFHPPLRACFPLGPRLPLLSFHDVSLPLVWFPESRLSDPSFRVL